MLANLSKCLCDELAKDGYTDMCFCGVQAGEQVLADYIQEGSCAMAWVRLAGAQGAQGEQGQLTPVNRYSSMSVIQIEVGHATAAVVPEGLETITEDQYAQMALDQATMMESAKRAIECCTWAKWDTIYLGQWQPYGPEGGIVGGSWLVQVEAS